MTTTKTSIHPPEIKKMNPHVASQIAAGEVVERPASIVKELVENSIDAHASRIEVQIRNGGIDNIRVTDNGHGIPTDQVLIAFEHHATSKLQKIEELETLSSLGFRGEALPSIATMSSLTCQSRTTENDRGTTITIMYGQLTKGPQTVGSGLGTTIEVNNIFAQQPARKKFLKTNKTEAARIQQVIERYAIAHPEIQFQYVNEGKEIFCTPGNKKLTDTVLSIMGHEIAHRMLLVSYEEDDIQINGMVSPADVLRSNRNEIALYVNQRWIQDRNLAWAIEQGYQKAIPKGRHPIAIISVKIPPTEVDVNVHPNKMEVRFRNESKIFSAVQRAVRTNPQRT